MKNLNLKKLTEGMHIKQKARLLFVDMDRQRETEGKERILTPDEENAIIRDCQNNDEIDALNRLNGLYHLTGLALADLLHRTLRLEVAMGRIEFFCLGVANNSCLDDTLEKILYLVEKGGNKKLVSEIEKIKTSETTKRTSLELFYKAPNNQDYEPNHLLQIAFLRALEAYKATLVAFYTIEYIEQLAGMSLVSEVDKEVLADSKADTSRFENLEGFMGVMKVFRAYYDAGFMQDTEFKEPMFKKLMLEPNQLMLITESEKKEAEIRIQRILGKHR